MERQARDGGIRFLLGFKHGEGNARGFVTKPLGDEIDEARFFEGEIAWRHGISGAGGHVRLKGAADVVCDERAEIGERNEFRMGANAVGRTGPDGVQHGV